MNYKELLCKPFKEDEHEWRIQSQGWKNGEPWAMVLCYVQARPIQDRLDEIFGVLGWKDEYRVEKGGTICRLSIKDDNGEWIAKENGSPETDIEAFKGGISKAFVRVAASGYGIGRYLYNLETTFAHCSKVAEKGWNKVYDKKENKSFWWQTPKLPDWAFEGKPRPREEKKSKEKKTKKQLIGSIIQDCMTLADSDPDKAKLQLEKFTSFQGKDDKIVKGTQSSAELDSYSEKRLQVVHGKLTKAVEEYLENN